jgi:putative tryptophan/tyrosine transport system substrate-binding protein
VRIGVLWNPANSAKLLEWQDTQAAAAKLGVSVISLEARSAAKIAAALELAEREQLEALIVLGDPLMTSQQARITEFTTRHRLPDFWETPENVEAGALLAYGPNRDDLFRRAAYYVDRILKGISPSELPVERPTRFYLVVNLRTAAALGITLPPAVLGAASSVIR